MRDPITRHTAWIIDLAAIITQLERNGVPVPTQQTGALRKRAHKPAPWWEE